MESYGRREDGLKIDWRIDNVLSLFKAGQ